MSIGETAYNAVYNAMPEARGTITLANGRTVIPCLCPSVELTRTNSEQGMSEMPSCIVRLLKSNEPETGLEQGKVITLTDSGSTAYRLRIHSRKYVAGILALLMVAENG
jgi:hypothetical protein